MTERFIKCPICGKDLYISEYEAPGIERKKIEWHIRSHTLGEIIEWLIDQYDCMDVQAN